MTKQKKNGVKPKSPPRIIVLQIKKCYHPFQLVALEKENKNLKNEANKKERAEELKVIGKSTQKDVKMHMLSRKQQKNVKNA